jgi:hypothetical protein
MRSFPPQTTVAKPTLPVQAALATIAVAVAGWFGWMALLGSDGGAPAVIESVRLVANSGPTAERTPWVIDRADVQWLSRHGVDGAELVAINRHEWDRLKTRMLRDPAVTRPIRYRGATLGSLVSSFVDEGR